MKNGQRKMEKGTESYTKAQQIANRLFQVAAYERRNDNSKFGMFFDEFYRAILPVMGLNAFAAQVAKTVDESADPYGFKIARLSSKQSWIIACAIVENNIDFKL